MEPNDRSHQSPPRDSQTSESKSQPENSSAKERAKQICQTAYSCSKQGFQKLSAFAASTIHKLSGLVAEQTSDAEKGQAGVMTQRSQQRLDSKQKRPPLFGSSLTQICAYENNSVPFFIQNSAIEIKKRSKTVGLFRICPQKTVCDKYASCLEKDHNYCLDNIDTESLCQLFKRFIQKLTPRLLSPQFMDPIVVERTVDQCCNGMLDFLFVGQIIMLRTVLQVLNNVHKNRDMNLMSSYNLAIAFIICLLPDEHTNNPQYMEVIQWLIENYDAIESWFLEKNFLIEPSRLLNDYSWGQKQ